MARTSKGISQALIYLEIIKRLPRHYITSTEIMQSLEAAGIKIETLTLQRYLKELSEAENSPIERDNRSRPFGYRLATTGNAFNFLAPSPTESLLLKLVQEQPITVCLILKIIPVKGVLRKNSVADARIFVEIIRKLFIVGEEPILKVPEKCRGFVLTAQGLQILFADIHKLKPDFAESAQKRGGDSPGRVAFLVMRIGGFNELCDFQKFCLKAVISFATVNHFTGFV